MEHSKLCAFRQLMNKLMISYEMNPTQVYSGCNLILFSRGDTLNTEHIQCIYELKGSRAHNE